MGIEVVTIAVADADRAKGFYESLGWRLDADLRLSEEIRAVQFTPLGSGCSVAFGEGLTVAEPGSARRFELVVADIEAARADLIDRGVEVGDLFHLGPAGFEPGPDPERASYRTFASFADPDGNEWLLQEVTERAEPGT
jgi:catechol 2,3-dioxygenase-like lactoylglutathione lyase family enzyme